MDNKDNEISKLTRIFALISGVATTIVVVVGVVIMLLGSQGLLVQIVTITALASASVFICLLNEQNNTKKLIVSNQTSRKQKLSQLARQWLIATSAAWLTLIILALAANRMTCAAFSFTSCTPKPTAVSGAEYEKANPSAAVPTPTPGPTLTPYYTFKSFEITNKGEQKIYTANETIQLFAGEKVDIKAQVATNTVLTGLDFYWFTCKKGPTPTAWGAGIVNITYTAPNAVGSDCIRLELKKGGKTIQKETLFVTVP